MGFAPPTKTPKDDAWLEHEWAKMFRATAPHVFDEAARRAAKALKFWPKPAEMVEFVEIVEQENESRRPRLPAPETKRAPLADLARNCGPEAKNTDFYRDFLLPTLQPPANGNVAELSKSVAGRMGEPQAAERGAGA
jgi:hypothetical protein